MSTKLSSTELDILDIAVNPDPVQIDLPAAVGLASLPESAPPQVNYLAAFVREVAETLVLTLIIFILVRTGVQNYRIDGQSMEPNFHHGQYLLVNKLTYKLGQPQRGDVVVFHFPRDPERDFIKRIVGLPGDTVEVRNRRLFVNGSPVTEPYDLVPMNYDSAPTLVDSDSLYVLGDNRSNSEDSHRWGLLPQDLVIGKAWISVWPYATMGVVRHEEVKLARPTALNP